MEDLKEFAKMQLARLAHLDGFSKTRVAISDYLSALLVAGSANGIMTVVDNLVSDETLGTKCPTAAMIRRIAYDLREKRDEMLKKCDICGGSGMVTVWKLVTYKGNSFVVARAKTLDVDYEGAREFNERLAKAQQENPNLERQSVLSAAKNCVCRGVAA